MQTPLEEYLSKIEKQLAALPIEQRHEEVREIRSHLQQMVEDNIARGDAPDAAVAKALEQFGAAEKVGRALKNLPNRNARFLRKVLPGVLKYLASMFAISIMLLYFMGPSVIPHPLSPSLNSLVAFALAWTLTFISPERYRGPASFKKAVTGCIMAIIMGIFFSFTFGDFSNFWLTAFFAGRCLRLWQIERQVAISN